MRLYQRNDILVQAWHVPNWGTPAAAPMPRWLVDRMIDNDIEVSELGGLTHAVAGTCLPGDYILLTENDEIEFCSAAAFELECAPVESEFVTEDPESEVMPRPTIRAPQERDSVLDVIKRQALEVEQKTARLRAERLLKRRAA